MKNIILKTAFVTLLTFFTSAIASAQETSVEAEPIKEMIENNVSNEEAVAKKSCSKDKKKCVKDKKECSKDKKSCARDKKKETAEACTKGSKKACCAKKA